MMRIYTNYANSTLYNNTLRDRINKCNRTSQVSVNSNKNNDRKHCIIIPNIIDDNVQPYSTVYNNANLQCKLTFKNSEDEKSDEELNLEVDREIYERNHLKDDGIEFNSPEFKAWIERNKKDMVIPVDAPGAVRKKLMDMMDAIPNENAGLKGSLATQIHNMFKNKSINSASDITSCCKNIIDENSDYINVVKLCGSDSEVDKNSIDISNKVINFFRQFENFIKLKYA